MYKMRYYILNLLIVLLLSSCGFRPALRQSDRHSTIPAVKLEYSNDINGSELAHYLSTIIPTSENAEYLLKVQFTQHDYPIAIQRNATVLRQNINVTMRYTLIAEDSKKVVLQGKIHNSHSYNNSLSLYTSYEEGQKAMEDLMTNTAEEIRTKLIVYFNSQHD